MRQEDRDRLEQIEELLDKLQEDFLSTYGQIRALLDSMSVELDEEELREMDEEEEDWDLDEEEEETFGEIVIDLDELFGED